MTAKEFVASKLEAAIAWFTSVGLITGSLVADLANWLHDIGLFIGVAIGALQLRRQWRNRNKD